MRVEKLKFKNLKENWIIFLMLAPTIIGVAIFSYIPAIEAIRHSFYRWDGAFIDEFVGLDNFKRILGNINLWFPLLIGGIFAGFSWRFNLWMRCR
jgi:ABC-type sugar transport system permease subunit